MKKLIFSLVLLFTGCAPAYAGINDYHFEVDATAVSIEHAWRGPEPYYAQFTDTLYGIGLTTWRNNFGFRVAYIDGAVMKTAGKFDYLEVHMKHIISFEMLYKYDITENLRVIGGIGTHLIPVPQWYEGIDPTSHPANDADNDEGYIIGLQYKLNNDFSIGWRFTHYSRIKIPPYDEWIKGHSVNITYRF